MSATAPTLNRSTSHTESLARATDGPTSHEAADLTDMKASIGLVLRVLASGEWLTDGEIHHAAVLSFSAAFTEQRLRTARASLVADGHVEATGTFGRTKYGRRTQFWRITESGRQVLA